MWSDVTGGIASAVAQGASAAVVEGIEAALPGDTLKTEFQAMASDGINGNGGAFVAFGSGAAMGSAIKAIRLSYTSGQPLTFRKAADATAAASAPDLFVVNQGEDSFEIPLKLEATDKLWVRSLSSQGVTSGFLTANLLG